MVKEVDDQPLFNSISEHVYHISKWYDKLLHLPPLNRHCKEHPDLSSPTEVDEIRPTLFFCSHQFQTLSFSAQFIYREKEKKNSPCQTLWNNKNRALHRKQGKSDNWFTNEKLKKKRWHFDMNLPLRKDYKMDLTYVVAPITLIYISSQLCLW